MPSVTAIGDMAYSAALRRQSADLKATVQRLSSEVTTGLSADPARRLSADLVPLAAIEGDLARLKGFATATSEAALFADAMQQGLAAIDRLAVDIAPLLLSATSAGHEAMIRTASAEAAGRLDSAVAALNARVGDRTLFAGTQSQGAAVAGADTILSALDTAIAGLTTAGDIVAAVDAWFDAPGGYDTLGYLGSAPGAAIALSPDDRVALDITAADPSIRDTLKGLAMGALVARLAGSLPGTERSALAREAGERLMSGQTGRADLAARLGTQEGRIEVARQRNTAETSAMELARSALLSIDPYEAATRLQAAEGQLEALYTVTARLARLSLVDFLR
jgi:flagellar hook-associated protein 3 FlgL